MDERELDTVCKLNICLPSAKAKLFFELAEMQGLTVNKLTETCVKNYLMGKDPIRIEKVDYTFLRFLIEQNAVEEIITVSNNIESNRKAIQIEEEGLQTGVIKSLFGDPYSWKDITDGDGNPSFSSKEEWEQHAKTLIKDWQDDIESDTEELLQYWNEYKAKADACDDSLEESLKQVAAYNRNLTEFLQDFDESEEDDME